MSKLDDQITALQTSTTGLKSAADGAINLLNSIKQMIADAVAAALAAGATPAELQAITDVGTALDTNTVALAKAVADNTPSPTPSSMTSKKPK